MKVYCSNEEMKMYVMLANHFCLQVLSDDGAVGQVNSGINEAAGYIEQGEQYRWCTAELQQ